jgi:threonine synthase
LELLGHDYKALSALIKGYDFTDDETRAAMRLVKASSDYVLDPHGAIGYLGLQHYLDETTDEVTGIFLETAHPAKFKEVVDEILEEPIAIPPALQKFLQRSKRSVPMKSDFASLKTYLQGNL